MVKLYFGQKCQRVHCDLFQSQDENDNSPIFDRNSYSIAIPENILAGKMRIFSETTLFFKRFEHLKHCLLCQGLPVLVTSEVEIKTFFQINVKLIYAMHFVVQRSSLPH